MTATELRSLCTQYIPFGGVSEHIYLKMPGPQTSSQETKPLAGNGSPIGKIASFYDGGLVVEFKASDVLAWLDKMEGKAT